MIDAQNLAARYIDSWNEADAATRRQMVKTLWTDDARYADPLMKAEGHDGIAALIGGVHAQFPGYRFALNGQADGHGPYVRFSWSLAPGDRTSDGHAVARGTDFASVAADGRLVQVTGFLDQMPGAV
jgi:SnoaL-like domain